MYPWESWLDGRVWLLVESKDFVCHPRSMRSQVRKAAVTGGQQVATRVLVPLVGDPAMVLFQAYPADSTWKPNLPAISWQRVKRALANPR